MSLFFASQLFTSDAAKGLIQCVGQNDAKYTYRALAVTLFHTGVDKSVLYRGRQVCFI